MLINKGIPTYYNIDTLHVESRALLCPKFKTNVLPIIGGLEKIPFPPLDTFSCSKQSHSEAFRNRKSCVMDMVVPYYISLGYWLCFMLC